MTGRSLSHTQLLEDCRHGIAQNTLNMRTNYTYGEAIGAENRKSNRVLRRGLQVQRLYLQGVQCNRAHLPKVSCHLC